MRFSNTKAFLYQPVTIAGMITYIIPDNTIPWHSLFPLPLFATEKQCHHPLTPLASSVSLNSSLFPSNHFSSPTPSATFEVNSGTSNHSKYLQRVIETGSHLLGMLLLQVSAADQSALLCWAYKNNSDKNTVVISTCCLRCYLLRMDTYTRNVCWFILVNWLCPWNIKLKL